MTWVDIEVNKKTAHLSGGAVVVAVSKKGKNLQRIFVTLRNGDLSPPLPFWKTGGMVRVQMGTGDDAGKVRVTPNGPHKLCCLGKKDGDRGITLQCPLPATIVSAGERSCNVEYDYNDTWLEITLPAWGKPVALIGQSKPSLPSIPAGPFRTTATIGKRPTPATGDR